MTDTPSLPSFPRQESTEQHIRRMLNDWRVSHAELPPSVHVAPDVWRELEEDDVRLRRFAGSSREINGVPVVRDAHAPAGIIWFSERPRQPKPLP